MSARIYRMPGYEKHKGGAEGAPFLVGVPMDDGRVVEAKRAISMNLAVQHLDKVEPFVSLSLFAYDHGAVFLALSAEDLRAIGAALLRSADTLDGGLGKQ